MLGAMPEPTERLSGRRAEAARNDRTILDAARRVFLDDPRAPIAAVAAVAGVGVGALYRRYESKDVLLQTLCRDGLTRFIAIAEAALADHDDPGDALRAFITGIVEADVHSLTVRLAGTFPSTDELRALADTGGRLAERLFRRARAAGAVRTDVHLNDLVMIFEQLAAIRLGDAERTRALRRRYLSFHLDALDPSVARPTAPGRAPSASELGLRWARPD
jgi:AcrR family transcriptional regulator